MSQSHTPKPQPSLKPLSRYVTSTCARTHTPPIRYSIFQKHTNSTLCILNTHNISAFSFLWAKPTGFKTPRYAVISLIKILAVLLLLMQTKHPFSIVFWTLNWQNELCVSEVCRYCYSKKLYVCYKEVCQRKSVFQDRFLLPTLLQD